MSGFWMIAKNHLFIRILYLHVVQYFWVTLCWKTVAILHYFLKNFFRFIPESPRWLLSQNKRTEALEITKMIAKENKKTLSKNIEVQNKHINEKHKCNIKCLLNAQIYPSDSKGWKHRPCLKCFLLGPVQNCQIENVHVHPEFQLVRQNLPAV